MGCSFARETIGSEFEAHEIDVLQRRAILLTESGVRGLAMRVGKKSSTGCFIDIELRQKCFEPFCFHAAANFNCAC